MANRNENNREQVIFKYCSSIGSTDTSSSNNDYLSKGIQFVYSPKKQKPLPVSIDVEKEKSKEMYLELNKKLEK